MPAARFSLHAVSTVALIAGLIGATAACGTEASTTTRSATQSEATWKQPSSYTYTLKSSEGERSLLGTLRVTVRDGKVTKSVGLDESGRRVVKQLPGEVPTIAELLHEMEQARRDGAHTAEAKYAADGHPVRISLDWDENAIDDEALYAISAYAPSDG
ncbi:DUF6174 domain-containing protein [Streptomyces sp. NPDC047197]|uniref:DUF6174 domain-containing protein n=1 Tax=Streptomyces sp. NPDC047197 TaxID=3155477 RepID=UPI0033E32B76